MFTNKLGQLCADAEAMAERIRTASDEEVGAVDERRGILRDALNSFNMRLQNLPERERNATLSLFYNQIVDIVFDFHLSLETSASRAKITSATTHEGKVKVLQEFRLQIQDLEMLYGIE